MGSIREEVLGILAELSALQDQIKELKAAYARQDVLTQQLQQFGFTALEYDGKRYELQDNFASTNVCYRAAFVRRYEMKITELSKKD